ncbi:MAG: type II secretion system protein GspN [Desulfobacterales bacterium]
MVKKKWFLYSLYAVVLAVIFVYYLFPAERLKTFIVLEANRIYPAGRVSIDNAGLVFPPGVRLSNVRLDHADGPVLFADDVVIYPHIKSLWGHRKVFSFKMTAYEGLVTGTAEMQGQQAVNVDAVVAGMNLSGIPVLQQLPAGRVEGILDATIAYAAGDDKPETVNATLDIRQMAVALTPPFLTLDRVRFEKVHADALLRHQHLEISRVDFSGDQIEGTLAGTASLSQDLMRSAVNLTGTVMPQKQFLDKSALRLPGPYLAGLKAKGGLPVRISGPLGALQLSTN